MESAKRNFFGGPSPSPRKKKRVDLGKTEKAKQYFDFGHDGTAAPIAICTLCKKTLSGKHEHNLLSHLRTVHAMIYYKIIEPVNDPIPIKRLKLLNNLVETVAVNGRPFDWILDSGYQNIIRPLLEELERAGEGIELTKGNLTAVQQHLHIMADKVRNRFSIEVKNRPLGLIIDLVQKNHRSIIGVSIQYIANTKLRRNSIVMIELKQSHTGKHLCSVICERLKYYGIHSLQILTITTNNGMNVLKMIPDVEEQLSLNTSYTNPKSATNERSIPNPSDSDENEPLIDENIARLLNERRDISNETELQILFDEAQRNRNETLLSELLNELSAQPEFCVLYDCTGYNCAADPLQLATINALSGVTQTHSDVIALSRQVCKVLRLKSTRNEINALTPKITYVDPHLDDDTRWDSTYIMLNDVKACWDVIEYYAEKKEIQLFKLLLGKWDILKELVNVLAIPFKATIDLQRTQLTLSETFGMWLKIKLRLGAYAKNRKSKTDLAKILLNQIIIHPQAITSHPLMAAALFLDPKYHHIIKNNEKKFDEAMKSLMTVWQRLIVLSSSPDEQVQLKIENTSFDNSSPSLEFDDQTALDQFLQGPNAMHAFEIVECPVIMQAEENASHLIQNEEDMKNILKEFSSGNVNNSESVIEFWEKSKEKYKSLYDLAMVVHSVPSTEVQQERDFSRLNFVFSDRRCKLLEESSEDIMCIHLNEEIFSEVKTEELTNAYNSL